MNVYVLWKGRRVVLNQEKAGEEHNIIENEKQEKSQDQFYNREIQSDSGWSRHCFLIGVE